MNDPGSGSASSSADVTMKAILGADTFQCAVESLTVECRFELWQPDGHAAATHYSLRFLIDLPDNLPPDVAQQVAQLVGQVDAQDRIEVGWADIVLCQDDPELLDILDGEDGDLGAVAAVVCDPVWGGFSDAVVEHCEFSGPLIIVNHVAVDPIWRGGRIGLIGTGLFLQHCSAWAMGAALWPMSNEEANAEQRKRSHQRLAQYWSRLGFQQWSDQIYLLSFA